MPHQPVLLDQLINLTQQKAISYGIDCTIGAGGHSLALLQAHPEIKKWVAIDQDPTALAIAKERLATFPVIFQRGNFAQQLKQTDPGAECILMDLGVSSMQLDRAERGMSFSKKGPLDMRMDPDQLLCASDIINHWSQQELEIIFRDLGEDPRAKQAARLIVENRPLHTTEELANLLLQLPKIRHKKINPLTLLFQGLRLAVNRELDVLKEALPTAFERLAPGGILMVISFHSLEDRIVKNFFKLKSGWKGGKSHPWQEDPIQEALLLTKKPLEATEDEIQNNPRSRSAKLRAIQKL